MEGVTCYHSYTWSGTIDNSNGCHAQLHDDSLEMNGANIAVSSMRTFISTMFIACSIMLLVHGCAAHANSDRSLSRGPDRRISSTNRISHAEGGENHPTLKKNTNTPGRGRHAREAEDDYYFYEYDDWEYYDDTNEKEDKESILDKLDGLVSRKTLMLGGAALAVGLCVCCSCCCICRTCCKECCLACSSICGSYCDKLRCRKDADEYREYAKMFERCGMDKPTYKQYREFKTSLGGV